MKGEEICSEVERRKAVERLHDAIREGVDAENWLWKAVIAYQRQPFYTTSGLYFTYIVRRRKDGEYSGELSVSRKEGSKTLTRSSVMLAFRTVLNDIVITEADSGNGDLCRKLIFPRYKGPKSIGQIFGISYVYSLFQQFGLIAE